MITAIQDHIPVYVFKYNYMIRFRNYFCVQLKNVYGEFWNQEIIVVWKFKQFKQITIESIYAATQLK